MDTLYHTVYNGLTDSTDNFSLLFTYEKPEHELVVSMDIPQDPQIGNSYYVNATVSNYGLNNETDVEFFLYYEGANVASTFISSLAVGASESISYEWTPLDYGDYNFTAFAPPVAGEIITFNNYLIKIVGIHEIFLF